MTCLCRLHGHFRLRPLHSEAARLSLSLGVPSCNRLHTSLNCSPPHAHTLHTRFPGVAGGDNFGEGNLDVSMIASFGLNVTTIVSNTNTSSSTEEGDGFGAALLDFLLELPTRATLPQVCACW
jgi:hypothetical protein